MHTLIDAAYYLPHLLAHADGNGQLAARPGRCAASRCALAGRMETHSGSLSSPVSRQRCRCM
eukprot:1159480-Pelagomonas_calceolata.AAC.9